MIDFRKTVSKMLSVIVKDFHSDFALFPADVGAFQSVALFVWENPLRFIQCYVSVQWLLETGCFYYKKSCLWWVVYITLQCWVGQISYWITKACQTRSSIILGPCCISDVRVFSFFSRANYEAMFLIWLLLPLAMLEAKEPGLVKVNNRFEFLMIIYFKWFRS